MQPFSLYGFNNITKSLAFNIYDICYAETEKEQVEYIEYIDEEYNSDRLARILRSVADLIGAQVLHVSKQDYIPQGSSITLLIAEGTQQVKSDTILAHLDKSHITAHTYPERHPNSKISTFRVDIDISTCGEISPLHTLEYLIQNFDSDVITMDYRIRGFTRDEDGNKLFKDHQFLSIQNYLTPKTLEEFHCADFNSDALRLYHTRMMQKNTDIQEYIFKGNSQSIPEDKQQQILELIQREMTEIFEG